ncbi:MAG: hypothetical protein ACE15B_14115 [Bryobacteraceae bacterium]
MQHRLEALEKAAVKVQDLKKRDEKIEKLSTEHGKLKEKLTTEIGDLRKKIGPAG